MTARATLSRILHSTQAAPRPRRDPSPNSGTFPTLRPYDARSQRAARPWRRKEPSRARRTHSGTAPGSGMEDADGKVVVMLPGVPAERAPFSSGGEIGLAKIAHAESCRPYTRDLRITDCRSRTWISAVVPSISVSRRRSTTISATSPSDIRTSPAHLVRGRSEAAGAARRDRWGACALALGRIHSDDGRGARRRRRA